MLTARRLVARYADKEVHEQGDLRRLDTIGRKSETRMSVVSRKRQKSFNRNVFQFPVSVAIWWGGVCLGGQYLPGVGCLSRGYIPQTQRQTPPRPLHDRIPPPEQNDRRVKIWPCPRAEVQNKNVSGTTKRTIYPSTRTHSSRMRTTRFSGRLRGVCLGGTPLQTWGRPPLHRTQRQTPTHCIVGYTPPWTEWQTSKNITLPQTSFAGGKSQCPFPTFLQDLYRIIF